LACSPAWEAATFASVDPDSITDIKALQCPLLVLRGTRQSTVSDRARAGLERRAPAARFEAVAKRIISLGGFLAARPETVEKWDHLMLLESFRETESVFRRFTCSRSQHFNQLQNFLSENR
jgi:alpha-beta hydrolase superfamily lysophospholipase